MSEHEWNKKLIEGAKKNIKRFRVKIAQLQKDLRKLTNEYWDIYNKNLILQDEVVKEKKRNKGLENKIDAQNAIISDLIKIIEEERISIKLRKKDRASIVTSNTQPQKKNKTKENGELKKKVEDTEIVKNKKEASGLRELIKEAIKSNIDTYA